jgi:hypothetical protein
MRNLVSNGLGACLRVGILTRIYTTQDRPQRGLRLNPETVTGDSRALNAKPLIGLECAVCT